MSIRIRGEVFVDAEGANTCVGSPLGGMAGVDGIAQTLWESTPTLQYKPFPSLITRDEFRYDNVIYNF